MSEQELIERLLKNDPVAFKQLIDEQKGRAFNTSLGILQNSAEAEDITQEVFIEVFESLKNFKGDSKLSTWIYRITITKSLEAIRRRKRKKRFGYITRLFQNESNTPEVLVPDFVHPGVLLENKEKATLLFKAIDSLPENQKIAFTLHKIEDMSYEEIAETMQVSLSAVESLIHRAKINLRKKLVSLMP